MKAKLGDTVRILHRDMWIVGEVLEIRRHTLLPAMVVVRDTLAHPTDSEYQRGVPYYASDIQEVNP